MDFFAGLQIGVVTAFQPMNLLYCFIGVLIGTYSSIFNAAPLLVVWEKQEWKTWFRKRKPQPASA